MLETMIPATSEEDTLARFKAAHPALFVKDDTRLYTHLGIVLGLLAAGTAIVVASPYLWVKIVVGAANAFLWFSLINATIHHHHTHHNAAKSPRAKKILDFLYLIATPNAPKRLGRYTRAHLNHHARPFHETDVDHHYGTKRFLRMMRKPRTALIYFLEMTFVGGHVPGWQDDRYMNHVPLESWNQKDYREIKKVERAKAVETAILQWGLFGLAVLMLPWLAWGWAYPMLLVKNWAHFLGQFQHYDERFLDPNATIWKKTRTYHFPGWINYLTGGEISGHFLHHLYPELPYYNVEEARRLFAADRAFSEFTLY